MGKRALLIGINYEGSQLALNGCINDVDNVQAWIVQHCGFAEQDITRLDDHTEVKPTRKNILNAIDELVAGLKAGDEVLFQYSGHGSQQIDRNRDEPDGYDEAIVPLDYGSAGLITDDVLRSRLCAAVPAGVNLFCIIDACHSSTSTDLKYVFEDRSRYRGRYKPSRYESSKWLTSTLTTHQRQYTETAANVLCISGCRDNSTSADAWVAGEGYTGAMTWGLLKTLKNAKAEGRDALSVQRLIKDTSGYLRVAGYRQVPSISSGRKIGLSQAAWVIFPGK